MKVCIEARVDRISDMNTDQIVKEKIFTIPVAV